MFDPSCSSPGYADGGPVPEPDTNQISKILVHMKDDKGGPPGTPSAEGPTGGDSDLEMASEDLMGALETHDPKAFAAAFRAMVTICGASDYDDDGASDGQTEETSGHPSGNPFAGKE